MKSPSDKLILIPEAEYALRLGRLQQALAPVAGAMLVADKANLYWLTGRVFDGFAYVPASGAPLFGLRRCAHLAGPGVAALRKVEDFAAAIAAAGMGTDALALETDILPWSAVERFRRAFEAAGIPGRVVAAGPLVRAVRAVKTPLQLDMLRVSGRRQEAVYLRIPALYTEGMTDYELQVEIEHASRLQGCLGQFRTAGTDMELFMGSVLTGDNADTPSPYDFAMGGAGMDPSLPVGADGSVILPGTTVMVDVNGNYTGYMTDMTRCYAAGTLPAHAMDAHRLSIDICHEIASRAVPGTQAKELYDLALSMAENAGLAHCFMGHRQHAGFVGHGIGIEVNELPVISPRSRDILQAGNVIAIEPKFVIPGVGAVGIENTYLVKEEGGMECMTIAPEEIIQLD